MLKPFVRDEFSILKTVILGISTDFGGCPKIEDAYDPKSKENILNNTFPSEIDIKKELDKFLSILEKYEVEVLRPQNIFACNQIFSRDIGFVIEDNFFISNMISNRSQELLGLELILKQINTSKIHHIPDDIYVEGGDVIIFNDYVFIGYSDNLDFNKFQVSRTNKKALDFFNSFFPSKQIIGFDLKKSDNISLQNCLHLDCCFQPLGLGHVIVYADGFKDKSDLQLIIQIFGEENVILINREEMSSMFSNIFSISRDVVVSEKKFSRLNNLLKNQGYCVEEVPFSEISKMGGLLRCTTLPLIRHYE